MFITLSFFTLPTSFHLTIALNNTHEHVKYQLVT